MSLAAIFRHMASLPQLADVTQKLGGEHLHRNEGVPPRAVWVPTTGSYRPGRVKNKAPLTDKRRSVGTWQSGFMVRLWAAAEPVSAAQSEDHIAAAEELLRRFLVALHQQGYGNIDVQGTAWVGEPGEEVGQFGRAIDLSLSIEIPIYEELTEAGVASALVTIGTQTMTADFPPEGVSGNDATGTPGV